MTTMYMHTLDGKPAYWVDGEIYFYATYQRPGISLQPNLRIIRRQQQHCIRSRLSAGLPNDFEYGHVRVEVPTG